MKKCLLLSLSCLASCAFAQKSFFGLDAGINVANQRILSYYEFANGTSNHSVAFQFNALRPTFGFFFQREFSSALAIRLSGQYMGLGYNYKGSFGADLNINYLTFPITLNYAVNKHLSFVGGPYMSFTLGGTKVNDQDITNTYHKNDFGFSLGMEHDIYKNLSLGINYFIGTKNIILQDKTTDSFGDTYSVKNTNRALQLTLIYKFKKPD